MRALISKSGLERLLTAKIQIPPDRTAMRKFTLMLLLSLVSSSAMAEWVKIAVIHSQQSPEIQTAYVDPVTIQKNGNLVSMSVLVDHQSGLSTAVGSKIMAIFSSAKGNIKKSWKVQDEFDCGNRKLRMLSYVAYLEQMGKGEIIPSPYVTSVWEPAVPESIGEALWKYACKSQ